MRPNLTLTETDLAAVGFAEFGKNVALSPLTLVINPQNIRLGSNVRIDAFCILSAGSAGMEIGNYVHLAPGVQIFGSGGTVRLRDFVGISGRCSLYTATDDFR